MGVDALEGIQWTAEFVQGCWNDGSLNEAAISRTSLQAGQLGEERSRNSRQKKDNAALEAGRVVVVPACPLSRAAVNHA